ncbi:GntR family transcriptional regulator/MocR family aminotransferase [Rhodoblastus sphagnicola]|nr:PLP-dependent aminotransferase family protein [Rhodoblastus sphagnicola]MBB4200203.1 GntR family transcriptional regulator/MocR family aminotransferase [Rhodoblastus sphagnicola]
MFSLTLNRRSAISLTDQIHDAVRDAIRTGTLAKLTRLPSTQDLSAQLGVARGTVRRAYDRLIDDQLIVSKGAAGTWVADAPAPRPSPRPASESEMTETPPGLFHPFDAPPAIFQMGVPAQDIFPFKQWSRIRIRATRAETLSPLNYPDPCGNARLRHEIAAYLAISRGVRCSVDQIFVTSGFTGALGMALQALSLSGAEVWCEDPGFPKTLTALQLAGLTVRPIPVDAAGLNVAAAKMVAGNAALAVVTPGQQAPLGMTMSLERRRDLLTWAEERGAWIIEDDYVGELQLRGRAAPALAAQDTSGRVLHIGTFSKTISPALRLGFLVVPPALAAPVGEIADHLSPAPNGAVQIAVADFMAGGHYLRHLRHMKRLYAARKALLADTLARHLPANLSLGIDGALSIRLHLPDESDDVAMAQRALSHGLAPAVLSQWYQGAVVKKGLLLCVTNVHAKTVVRDCEKLLDIIMHETNTSSQQDGSRTWIARMSLDLHGVS